YGGQVHYDPSVGQNWYGTNPVYGIKFDINRYEFFGKLGYIFPENRHRSIGLQISTTAFDQVSQYGTREYQADQKGFYANLIYQDILGTVEHKYRAGISTQWDRYAELYRGLRFNREEIVPGAFVEYTYSPSSSFDVVAGLRGDYNSLYGWFATPRVH